MRAFKLLATLAFISTLPAVTLAQGRPAMVETADVALQSSSDTIAVFGQIVSGRESAVAARVAGVVESVPPRVGAQVTAGQILAQLDTELLSLQIGQAEAEAGIAAAGVGVAEARVDRAERALRRAETLRENANISQAQLEDRLSDFDEAVATRAEAQARLRAAEVARSQAQYAFDNAIIRAPFDAVVLEVNTEVGQFISVGSQVVTLLDIGAMEVEANVPARFISALQSDQPVAASTDVGGTLEVTLRAILPTEFAATRTRPVRFEVTQPDVTIAVGQTVTLDIPVSAPREVVSVPKDALVQGAGGWMVFVNADGTAQPRPVDIGAAMAGGFEVLSGLAPGDQVVVRGNERLRPGQSIMSTNAPPPTADAETTDNQG